MLTAKGKYGLKALVYLSALQPGSTAHAIDVAKASNISKKFLDTILSELRRAGLVKTKRGPGGGYMAGALCPRDQGWIRDSRARRTARSHRLRQSYGLQAVQGLQEHRQMRGSSQHDIGAGCDRQNPRQMPLSDMVAKQR
jgi:Iron-dependent Transcriptional regulator